MVAGKVAGVTANSESSVGKKISQSLSGEFCSFI
jgi:hypothetical protein